MKVFLSRFVFCIVISIFIGLLLPSKIYAKPFEIEQSSFLHQGAPYEMYEYYEDNSYLENDKESEPGLLITRELNLTYYCVDPETINSSRIEGHISLTQTRVGENTGRLLSRFTEYDINKVVTFCKPNTCVSSPKPFGGGVSDARGFINTTSCSLSIANGGQCSTDSDCRSNHCNSFHKCDAVDPVPGFEKTNPDPIDDYFGNPFLTPELGDGETSLISPDPSEVPISPALKSCADLSCDSNQTCMTDMWGSYCSAKLIQGMYCTGDSQCSDNLTCNATTSTCTSDETLPPVSSENNDSTSESEFCNAQDSYCTGDSQEPCQCNDGKKCDSDSVLFCQDYL